VINLTKQETRVFT